MQSQSAWGCMHCAVALLLHIMSCATIFTHVVHLLVWWLVLVMVRCQPARATKGWAVTIDQMAVDRGSLCVLLCLSQTFGTVGAWSGCWERGWGHSWSAFSPCILRHCKCPPLSRRLLLRLATLA